MSWKAYIKKELKEDQSIFLDIIRNFDYSGIIIFKERNTLRKIETPKLGTLAVKSFKKPHLLNQYIYNNFRKSKAYRSFYHAEILLSKGINTPLPLAYFEESQNGKLLHSFYFSEYYPYDFTFRELIESKNSFPDWDFILKSFTEFIHKIHEASILFKDLSPGNVLIKRVGSGYEFSLVDLNRMSFRDMSLDERTQNFIRLSLTDEMISIIGSRYEELTGQDKNEVVKSLTKKNKNYKRRKEQKKVLKKLIDKN